MLLSRDIAASCANLALLERLHVIYLICIVTLLVMYITCESSCVYTLEYNNDAQQCQVFFARKINLPWKFLILYIFDRLALLSDVTLFLKIFYYLILLFCTFYIFLISQLLERDGIFCIYFHKTNIACAWRFFIPFLNTNISFVQFRKYKYIRQRTW